MTEIIVKTKDEPLFTWEGKPTFRTDAEEVRWWERQKVRWEDGWGGLTGLHYWTVTQGKLKNARNKVMTPDVRDGDMLVYGEIRAAEVSMSQDLFIAKRRGFALSTIFGGARPMHRCIVDPGSTNLVTSADKKRLEELYKEKTQVMYDNLDPKIKPALLNSRVSGYYHFAEKGGKGTNSKILCIQTTESESDATAFEAYRASTAFIDEVFLHPRPDKVVASSQASLMDGFVKVGPIILGGSCGVASVKGAKLMQEYWLDAENNDVRTLFIPGWMCISEAPELDENGKKTGRIVQFCPGGRSDEKAATEWILATRARLAKAKNTAKLLQFIKAYPLSIEEVFDVNANGYFTEDISDMINAQALKLTQEKPFVAKYDLYENEQGNVVARPNQVAGKFSIAEPPRTDQRYGAGNDPIPFGHSSDVDDKENASRSKNALAIGTLPQLKCVAWYKERTHDADQAAMDMLLLCRLYNVDWLSIERNRGSLLIDKVKTQGGKHLLSKEPMWMGASSSKKRPFGWYKDARSAPLAYGQLVHWIKECISEQISKELVDELKVFIVDNTDIADAWVSFLVEAREDAARKLKANNLDKEARTSVVVTMVNGQRVVQEKTVYVDVNDAGGGRRRPDVFNYGR